jgi:hypothetical protein
LSKKWWKSKTVWFNIVSLIVFIGGELSGTDVLDPKILAIIMAFGNGVLRTMTKQPLG